MYLDKKNFLNKYFELRFTHKSFKIPYCLLQHRGHIYHFTRKGRFTLT